MGQYITAALVGSLATIIIQAIINAFSDKVKYKRELRSLVFQRKLEVVERAMSWYQNSLDTYLLLQMALKEYDKNCNELTIQKIQFAAIQLNQLFQETTTRLNGIYLYYDFSDIEKKHKSMESVYSMNKLFNIIANISDKISEVDPSDFESQFYQALQDERVNSAHQLADVIGGLINLITEIEQKLRKEYSDYLK